MLFPEIIEKHAAEKKAFICNDKVTTYGEFREKVKEWANFLQAKGIKKGERVGLFSKNCTEFAIAYFAIIKAGAVVVPFNFQLASREVAYIVKDAQMSYIITKTPLDLTESLKELEISWPVEQLTYEDFKPVPEHTYVDPQGKDTDNCTIIYTSGTTGQPKGAMLSHKNLIANTLEFAKVVEYKDTDVTICVLPMYHCFAWTVTICENLYAGACIVIQETYVFKTTMQLIAKYQVDTFVGVPTMMQLFLQGAKAEELKRIRFFISGGAPLPTVLSEEFHNKFGKYVQEGYGLSEASPVVTVNPGNKIKNGSIGPALPNVDVKILDEEGKELPIESIGEICAKGDNVMLGYLNLPEETASSLINGYLHTGDLGYKDAEGYIFIVDRLKDMIITGGENIYPREVEENIYAHNGVKEVAVVGTPDKLRGQKICAFVVLKEGATVDKTELRKFLLGRIAPYKVPKEYFFLEELPKNATGKILKKELRVMAAQG